MVRAFRQTAAFRLTGIIKRIILVGCGSSNPVSGQVSMRRLVNLILLAALVLGAFTFLRAQPVQDWLDRQDQSPLPDAAVTALAEQASATRPAVSSRGRGLVVLPEDGRFAILGEINAARATIDLYIYLLPADEVIDALHDAHNRGVAVRVILERDPFGGGNSNQAAYDRLEAAGIEVRWSSDRFRFSHVKTFVVDSRVAVVMTLNLSWTALTANREFAVITTAADDVATISALFQADWNGGDFAPSGSIVTSPDNSREVVTTLITRAKRSIEIYAEVVRDRQVRDQLIAAARAGVTVRILVPTGPSEDDLLVYRQLEANGIQIKLLADKYSHAKAIIVDGTVALVGSQNLTQTSLTENREVGIVLDDVVNVGRLRSWFDLDWNASDSIT